MEILMALAKTPPQWLDKSFFEKVIRQSENDDQAVVENFEVKPGSKPGDNFSSAVFRAAITYKLSLASEAKTINTFVKVEPQYPPEFAHMQNRNFFKNEIEMFGNVLPEIQSLWTAAGYNDLLCPRLIYQSIDPAPVIILEDVSGDGFSVTPKPTEDFEVSKRIIRRLAKFHAATFFLAAEKSQDFTKFNFTLFQDPMTQNFIDQAFGAFIDTARNWEGFEKFIPNLDELRKTYWSQLFKTYSFNKNEFAFNILNHGDFHLRNVMFKKNEADDSVEDFLFIDYQICNYATPAIDLIFALYFFVSPENRQQHRDEFIAIYYQQFAEALKKFGYEKTPPSLIDLQVEMLRNGCFEVILATSMSIFFFFDMSKIAESGIKMDLTSPAEGLKMMYQLPGFKDIILKELPRWLNNGFI